MRPGLRQVLLGRRAYEPEALTLFAAMTTAPSSARKTAINTLIAALKSAGVWSALDLFYMLAAADSQAALLNWVNPGSFTAVEVNAPTFTANQGYAGNGTTSRLRTQFTPSLHATKATITDTSAWLWSLTAGQASVTDLGNGTSPRTFIRVRNTSDQSLMAINNGSSSMTVSSVTDGTGLFGTSRKISTTQAAWRNGVSLGTQAVASGPSLPAEEQWICGANSTNFSTRQIASAAWGASLDGKESALYTAKLAYMQAVGAV